jgi:hypothetical protein
VLSALKVAEETAAPWIPSLKRERVGEDIGGEKVAIGLIKKTIQGN